MKKIVGAILGLAIIAPMAMAQDNVLSQNAVGFVKVTINEGELALVRYDFENIDGSTPNLESIVGDQLPNNSAAYYWDRVAKTWQLNVKSARSGWPAQDIARGDAFFLLPATGGGQASYDVHMLGEVPGSNNNADTTPVSTVEGDAVGFPYPASTLMEDTDLGTQAAANSAVYTWDAVGQAWNAPVLKSARSGWGTLSIEPGEGYFFLSTGGNIDAVETKPYDWP